MAGMADTPLTLMAVHAHPDDESSSTGGVLARYAEAGVRTVLVTCTNGEYGDGPGGVKPGAEGHDPDEVKRIRLAELDEAVGILDVTHLELLGYCDSGMVDWDYRDHERAFCQVPLEESTARLVALFEQYRPDVVITYDHEGPYNHPDHVQASLITMAAVARTAIPKKTYFTGMRRGRWDEVRRIMEEQGVELPAPPPRNEEWERKMAEVEARITTTIDVAPYVDRKRRALGAHVSQMQSGFWGKLPDEAYAHIFGEESFVRVLDRTGAPVPEDDLFAGIA
jgi:LmbE family N-acetylglucosaminyl deacetylase